MSWLLLGRALSHVSERSLSLLRASVRLMGTRPLPKPAFLQVQAYRIDLSTSLLPCKGSLSLTSIMTSRYSIKAFLHG